MKYIEDFKEDDHIVGHYLCKQRQNLKSRAGKTYLSLRLQDKTGIIDAKVWDLNNDIQSFEEGNFIKIDAIVLSYQNDLQLKVTKIRRSSEGEYEPMDYIPCTNMDINQLMQQLDDYIKSISSQYIRRLMENIFIKNNELRESFKKHSAAKNMHHSYMGGLAEHTLSVVGICDFLSGHYKAANRDILIAAAILHDVGKIYELSDFPANDYTDDGQLLGHIFIGSTIVKAEAEKIPDFPAPLKSMLMHCILSHHGEYEYGSPKRPKTIEAFILHCADNLDAKVKVFQEAVEGSSVQGSWVGYNKMMARNIRKSDF